MILTLVSDTSDTATLGRVLRALRLARGYSEPGDLARRVDVSAAVISACECDAARPDAASLRRMENALGVERGSLEAFVSEPVPWSGDPTECAIGDEEGRERARAGGKAIGGGRVSEILTGSQH